VGTPRSCPEREAALADWARIVVRDPTVTTEDQVARLRAAGLDDREIFEATVLVAFRLAFSTVNDALGAKPDRQLADEAPAPVRDAVSFGRPASQTPSFA
jgi:alkylhydroperoxidase family enzyme